jgi:hypothetical protein
VAVNERSFWRRWGWLSVPCVLAIAGVGAGPLGVHTEHAAWASCLISAAIGYTLWFAGASVPGILLWIAAAAMLGAAVWTTTSLLEILAALGGALLALVAGVVFLVASIKNRRRCSANCAGCTLAVFAVLICWFPGLTIKVYRERREANQDQRQMILALHRLATEIDAISARLGRSPRDDAELAALRGKPLPPHFLYTSQGDKSYLVIAFPHELWGASDMFGWSLEFYGGPDAVPRIQVSGF